MKLKNITLISFSAILLQQSICEAQQKINLVDVSSFELVSYTGGMSGFHQNVQVVRDSARSDSDWKSYQTAIKTVTDHKNYKLIDNHDRVFIKPIPQSVLKQLLSIIVKPDTGFNIDRFKLDLTQFQIDTAKKADHKKAAAAKKNIQDILLHDLKNPFMKDDVDTYIISVITTDGKKSTIKARSFVYLYNLPWYIGKLKCYDPTISIIYAQLCGDNAFVERQNKMLYKRITPSAHIPQNKN